MSDAMISSVPKDNPLIAMSNMDWRIFDDISVHHTEETFKTLTEIFTTGTTFKDKEICARLLHSFAESDIAPTYKIDTLLFLFQTGAASKDDAVKEVFYHHGAKLASEFVSDRGYDDNNLTRSDYGIIATISFGALDPKSPAQKEQAQMVQDFCKSAEDIGSFEMDQKEAIREKLALYRAEQMAVVTAATSQKDIEKQLYHAEIVTGLLKFIK